MLPLLAAPSGKLALIVVNAQAVNATVVARIEGCAGDLTLSLGPWEVVTRKLSALRLLKQSVAKTVPYAMGASSSARDDVADEFVRLYL